jgi:hypothetical protein
VEVIGPPGELYSETNDNSLCVAIVLTYGTRPAWSATRKR